MVPVAGFLWYSKIVMVKKIAILSGVIMVLVAGGLVWYFINQSEEELSSFETSMSQADELAEAGDVEAAVELLEEEAASEEDDDKKSSLYARQGSLLAASGDTEGAIAAAQKAAQTNQIPEAPSVDDQDELYAYFESVYVKIAEFETYLDGGEYPEEEIDGLDDTHKRAIALGNIARLYDLVGDTQRALEYYKEALDFLEANPEVEDFGERQQYRDRIEQIEG